MKRLSGYFRPLRKATDEQIQRWSKELIGLIGATVRVESAKVRSYVDRHQNHNLKLTPERLARRSINRRSIKAGGIGAICGLGGILTIPITMPADMYYTFRIQARMVLALALIFGRDIHDDESHTEILLVMGGNAAANALKGVGIKLGREWTQKAVQQHITRETMKKINQVVSRKIITKAGEKSVTSFAKLVPLVGAPIGAAFDFASTQIVGRAALKFYQG